MFVAFNPGSTAAAGSLAIGFGICAAATSVCVKRPKSSDKVRAGVRTGEPEVSIPRGLGAEEGWV